MTSGRLKSYLARPFVRFLVVGSGAFMVEYGTFYAMYSSRSPLIVANSVSFGLGLLTSFILNRLWTFSHKEYAKKPAHQLTYYVILALINLLLTNLFVELFSFYGVTPKLGKIFAMLLTSSWNYFIFQRLIFIHKKSETQPIEKIER
jgi:putative flippase GtrA